MDAFANLSPPERKLFLSLHEDLIQDAATLHGLISEVDVASTDMVCMTST